MNSQKSKFRPSDLLYCDSASKIKPEYACRFLAPIFDADSEYQHCRKVNFALFLWIKSESNQCNCCIETVIYREETQIEPIIRSEIPYFQSSIRFYPGFTPKYYRCSSLIKGLYGFLSWVLGFILDDPNKLLEIVAINVKIVPF